MTNDANRPVVEKSSASGGPSKLTITRQDLAKAANQSGVGDSQIDAIWATLSSQATGQAKFNFLNIAAYAGAFLVLLAMGGILALFAKSPESITAISAAYMVIFAGAGLYFNRDKQQIVPAGLLMTLAVSMAPAVTLSWFSIGGGLELNTSQQLIVEFSTILAGVIALQFVRFPFITAPIYASLWFMAMTFTNTMTNGYGWLDQDNLVVSMVFGALVTFIAYAVDKKTKEDYSFWGYFFGLLMLWGAWTFMDRGGEFGNFIYFVTNIALMVASVVLNRKIFLVFGTTGAIGYLGYVTWELFEGSMMFPFALLGLGCLLIYATILYRRHGNAIEGAILGLVKKD